MQSAFTMLRPTLALSKAVHVVDKAIKDDPIHANKWDEFSEGFRALETWGNDNVSFPGACYVRYIEELYRNDALMKGTFTLSGTTARLEKITVPTMCIVFEHDNIVPWQNAAVLVDKIGSTDKELLKLPGGHVGAVVSRGAQKALWPRMSAFWAKRDADVKLRVDEHTNANANANAGANGHAANGHATNGHAANGEAVVEAPVSAPASAPAPLPRAAKKKKMKIANRSGGR
jgi:polyhydroxyalkanoate synthase